MCRRSDDAERSQLLGVGQFAVDQQVAGFDEVAVLGEHFDRIAAVAEDALFAVEKRDGAGRRAGVDVALVERDVAGLGPQLRDVDRAFVLGADDDRQLDLRVLRFAAWPPRSSRLSFLTRVHGPCGLPRW